MQNLQAATDLVIGVRKIETGFRETLVQRFRNAEVLLGLDFILTFDPEFTQKVRQETTSILRNEPKWQYYIC